MTDEGFLSDVEAFEASVLMGSEGEDGGVNETDEGRMAHCIASVLGAKTSESDQRLDDVNVNVRNDYFQLCEDYYGAELELFLARFFVTEKIIIIILFGKVSSRLNVSVSAINNSMQLLQIISLNDCFIKEKHISSAHVCNNSH